MADVTVTAANVVPTGSSLRETGIAGVALTAGKTVYKEAATGQFKLADADHATLEARIPYGITCNDAAIGQPVTVVTSGDIGFGVVLTAGIAYYQSDTPGGIGVIIDLEAGDRIVFLGFATTTANLNVRIVDSGVVL